MGAGFKRDIGGGAARRFARLGKRDRLGMGAAAVGGMAAPDDTPVAHQDAAHRRVGPDTAQTTLRQAEGRAHPAHVFDLLGHSYQSSLSGTSGRSSATNSSKSSAAWKFL